MIFRDVCEVSFSCGFKNLLSSVCQLFGCGSVAQTVLSRNTLGEPLTVHIGFSVGLMMAAYVAGGVSGKYDFM